MDTMYFSMLVVVSYNRNYNIEDCNNNLFLYSRLMIWQIIEILTHFHMKWPRFLVQFFPTGLDMRVANECQYATLLVCTYKAKWVSICHTPCMYIQSQMSVSMPHSLYVHTKPNNVNVFGSKKTKRPKHDR